MRAVCLHPEGGVIDGNAQNRFRAESFLESLKCLLLLFSPHEGLVACELVKRSCDFGKVLYKPPVEVEEADEGLHLHLVGWDRPISHGSDLLGVGSNLSIADDESEVSDLFDLEEALVGFEVELMLS